MKKAIIQTGSKQYLVSEGETLEVELLKSKARSLELQPLLVIDGDKTKVGAPLLSDNKVKIEILDPEVKAEKVTAIRYKAKKRVKKIHGHRQRHTLIKIVQIS